MVRSRKKNKGRPISGVVLLDKPYGLSSNHALQRVKHLFNAQKAGHTGSLDPLATGMLPICLGEATKISAYLLDADKTYRFKCKLGSRTSTGDAEGEIIDNRPFEHIRQQDVERVLAPFMGEIDQIPPMYSALKKDGQRLYELARQGVEVERKPRQVIIHNLKLMGFDSGEADIMVHCSKGTYIRTLAEDIGEALGCGAFVSELKRLRVGPYDGGMISLDQIQALAEQGLEELEQILLPVDSGIVSWPEVHLDADSAYYIKLGQAVQVPRAPSDGWVRVYDDERFLGVGRVQDDGRIAPKRMIKA